MTREEAHNRIDSLIAQHEIDDVYVTITNFRDYDALRMARKLLEQEPCQVSQGLVKDSQGFSQEPCDDAVSKQAVRDTIFVECSGTKLDIDFAKVLLLQRAIKALPPVTPQPKMEKCKDCKWWRDSDGTFRRGIGAKSQCPINRIEVFNGNGYCYMYEPQESEGKE